MKAGIVFMGTPDFAVASLNALYEAGEKISAVVTAPDRPAGRGRQMHSSPVKTYALEHNITVLQPVKLRDESFISELEALNADIFVVVAFRILPREVWSIPRLGTFNLHASLLPQYRGAAPINWAIINGEKETGLTTFIIDEEIDTGKIIMQEKVTVSFDMTAGQLHDILMIKGAGLVVKTVEKLRTGKLDFIEQAGLIGPGTVLMPAPKLFREDCRIRWNHDNIEVYNLIRGLSPHPGSWTNFINEHNEALFVKILRAELSNPYEHLPSGTITVTSHNEIIAHTQNGALSIIELQPAGKKSMRTAEFLRGYRKKFVRAE